MHHVMLGNRAVGPGHPVVIVAELSGNHGGSLHRALSIIEAAAAAGVDAVKLQTYTPDSLTIDCDAEWFRVKGGTLWDGQTLYDLYGTAMTPWEWTAPLFERARTLGMLAFSTPFDEAAIGLLERLDPPAHKVASFELVDHDLLRAVASTGRPVIVSTGLAQAEEIDEALAVLQHAGAAEIVVLWCNSAYPADPAELNLRTIPDIADRWDVPVGFSDHTMSSTSAIAAVALGACLIEKHVTLSRSDGGPDSAFSLEPDELRAFVAAIREAEVALGEVRYGPTARERPSLAFRRSLFFVRDLQTGEVIGEQDIRSIRPGHGLAPRHRHEVLGRAVAHDVKRGTPVSWDALR